MAGYGGTLTSGPGAETGTGVPIGDAEYEPWRVLATALAVLGEDVIPDGWPLRMVSHGLGAGMYVCFGALLTCVVPVSLEFSLVLGVRPPATPGGMLVVLFATVGEALGAPVVGVDT